MGAHSQTKRLKKIRNFGAALTLGAIGILSGCGGGGGGTPKPIPNPTAAPTASPTVTPTATPTTTPTATPTPAPQVLTGAAVDGPIANAVVKLYKLDTSQAFLQGELLDEGETDAQAQFSGLEIPTGETGPFLIVVTADDDTVDLNTGRLPIITEVRTVLKADRVGEPVYATPLTSMAVALAASKAGEGGGGIDQTEFTEGLDAAADELVSALGFGMDDSVDIFAAPPLVTDSTDTNEKLSDVAAYRTAISGAAAIIFEIQQNSEDSTADQVLADLADDLSDGAIDGQNSKNESVGDYDANDAAIIMETDPSKLKIPGTDTPINDTQSVLDQEKADTGSTANTSSLLDGTVETKTKAGEADTDRDNDGVINTKDAFPNDPNESVDTDHDGVGNNADPDDDNDGVKDENDAFPLNANEKADSDGDGTGDNADTDDDGDGVPDTEDDFPLDPSASNKSDVDNDGWPAGQDPDDNDANNPGITFVDTDNDGKGNSIDSDDDNDGVPDDEDDLPLDASDAYDSDGDGIGDSKDDDIDGDGVNNHTNGNDVVNTRETRAENGDAFPFNADESSDMDFDGIGDNSDSDADGDGLLDVNDPDPTNKDTDGDGVRDGADALPDDATETLDTDKDGIGNNSDNCKFKKNSNQTDTDSDSIGDACDPDDDNDGVIDTEDDFPLDPSAQTASDVDNDGWPVGQDTDDNDPNLPIEDYVDTDGDGAADSGGLAPDNDDDNDGVNDDNDAFPTDPSEFKDFDGDKIGDIADLDDDNDGVNDDLDAFPYNKDLSSDVDHDGVDDSLDNCPNVAGPQTDFDEDGKGNVCDDDDDNDGVKDIDDAFPRNKDESADRDGDGIGNNADTDDDGDGVSDADEAELGTNPLRRDTDNDGTSDAADNCPLVPNPDQVDSDQNGVGNLCDNPPDVSGYYLLDMTVAIVEGELNSTPTTTTDNGNGTSLPAPDEIACENKQGDVSAEIALLSQMGTDLKITFAKDEFSGENGAHGNVNSLGQVVIQEANAYQQADGTSEQFSLLFLGLENAVTGVITGTVEEERKHESASGEMLLHCYTKTQVVMTPMPEVSASDVLDANGSDGGFLTTHSHRDWSNSANSEQMAFMYNLLNTENDVEYRWSELTSSWEIDSAGDKGLVLTANGWEPVSPEMLVENVGGNVVSVVEVTMGGTTVNSWDVNTYSLSVVGKPMLDLVDDGWSEYGLKDPTAAFIAGANALAIHAVSQNDVYNVYCDGDDWAKTGLSCPNFIPTSWADDGMLETMATTFADVIHANDATFNGVGGIWVARTRDGWSEIMAFLQGDDTTGDEGTSGVVSYYYNDFSGMAMPLTHEDGTPLTSTWEVTDPLDDNSHLIVTFDLPEGFSQQYDTQGNDESAVMLAVVADTEKGDVVRTGRMMPGGEEHRAGGLNLSALEQVLSNFEYTAPPTPTPGPTMVPTPNPTGGPNPTPDPSQNDIDNDGKPDMDDNCQIVANPNQDDADGDGIGDACDIAVPVIDGAFLGQLTFTEGSEEFDDQTGACVASQPEAFMLKVHMVGNQMFMDVVGDKDKDPGLAAVVQSDGSFVLVDGTSGNYNSAENSFTFSFTETSASADGATACTANGTVAATPPAGLVEETVLNAGISWIEGFYDDTNGDGMPDAMQFEYGTINNDGPEKMFHWSETNGAWVEDTSSDQDHYLTANGIIDVDDRYMVSGYVDGSETAIINPSIAGQPADVNVQHVNLGGIDLAGLPLAAFVPQLEMGLNKTATFSAGAQLVVAKIESISADFRFSCDDNWDDWFANLVCANIVPIGWDQVSETNGDPIPARTLDDVVNLASTLDTGAELQGALWAGHGYDEQGPYDLNAFLVSSDGTAVGSGLNAVFVKNSKDTGSRQVVAETPVTTIMVGAVTVLEYSTPDHIMGMSDMDNDMTHRFVFVDTVTETEAIVRQGVSTRAGEISKERLYNAVALSDILSNFNYVAPIATPTPVPTPMPTGIDPKPTDDPGVTPVPTPNPSGDPNPTPMPQFKDVDSDGKPDMEDNCPLIANEDQADTDQDGIGDVCDLAVSEIFGVYLAEMTNATGSEEFDDVGGSCVSAEGSEHFIIETYTTGNQVFIRDREDKEDEGIGAIMASDNTFTLVSGGTFVGTGEFFPVNNSFQFSFSDSTGNDTTTCTSSGTFTAVAPAAVVEKTAFDAGITWMEGNEEDWDGDGVPDSQWYEYGSLTTSVLETQFEWDSTTGSWIELTTFDEEAYLTTSAGIQPADDRVIVDGFADAANGQTAILKMTSEGIAVDYRIMEIELEAFDMAGLPMQPFVNGLGAGLSETQTFSSGAVVYVAHIKNGNDVYNFWCDDDWDTWFDTNLDCDNIVVARWGQEADGTTIPVPATTLNEVVNTEGVANSELTGALWAGNGVDDQGQFDINGYFISSDGTTSGSNLHVAYIKHYWNAGVAASLNSSPVTSSTIGGTPVLEFTVPESVAQLGHLHKDELSRFIFQESQIESTGSYVRQGMKSNMGEASTELLFNNTARDDVLTNFSL